MLLEIAYNNNINKPREVFRYDGHDVDYDDPLLYSNPRVKLVMLCSLRKNPFMPLLFDSTLLLDKKQNNRTRDDY